MNNTNYKSGIILPEAQDMPRGSESFFRWIGFFFRPYRAAFIAFFLLRVTRYAILYILPLAIGLIIKSFENGWAYEHPGQLALYTVCYMALYAFTLFSIAFFVHESAAQDRMVRGMTMFSIRYMNSLPLNWHEEQGSGGKLQRIMTARSALKGLVDIYKWSLVPFLGALIAICFSVAVLDAPLWFLLFYAGFSFSFCWIALHTARHLPDLHNSHNAVLEKLLSGVYEFVSAVRTVKAFGMERYIDENAKAREQEGHTAWRSVLRAIFRKWTFLNLTACFWLCVFLGVCLAGMYGKWIGIGAFATLFYLAYDLWKTLENLVYVQDQFIEYRAGFMRLTQTLKAEPKALDLAPATPLKDWDAIKFENVSFHYGEGGKHALENITLAIARGEKIALVGPSGAGKSTFIKLLLKQMWPIGGRITAGGDDLRHIPSSDWLSRTGFVPQDVELFNMSIRDNVLLGSVDEVSEEQYRQALKDAAFDEFVQSLPEGDATIIGERGIKLSGGQRQRLGIARALVRQAELVVFDEATSSLDSLSEQAIQDAIEQSFAGKTLVVIAHRLSTVRHVDRIFVFENGKLAEQGSFADLVKKNGIFARMWELQSGHYMQEAG